jgi:hypothetical protein
MMRKMFGKITHANSDLYVLLENDLSKVDKNRLNQPKMDKHNQSLEPIQQEDICI